MGAARDAAASLAAAGESEADAVAALVDYTVTFGARYCPKALEQVFAQAAGDVAESLTDGITSFDAAIPLAVQAAWLEADAFARELFAVAPGDVVAFEDALSGWQAALEFAQAAFEAAGGLLPEEQDAVDRASDGVDVYVAGFQPFRPAPGVSLADVLRSGPVEGFESDAPVAGFHCVEIAPGGFEVIEEEFFPAEFAPVAPLLGVPLAPAGPVVIVPGEIPPDAIWRLQAAGVTGLFIAADYPSRALALAAVSTVPVGWPWFVSWFVLVRDLVSGDLRASALTTTDSGVR